METWIKRVFAKNFYEAAKLVLNFLRQVVHIIAEILFVNYFIWRNGHDGETLLSW